MNKQQRLRREFLKRSAHAALLGTGGAAVSGKLNLLGSALAAQGDYANLPGYKALVCVFLFGGSDSFNMFVPYEQALYDAYQASRGGLSLDRSELVADSAQSVLFNPNLTNIRDSYNAGNLAIIRNAGNLIEPLSLAQFSNNPENVPADLFSHNSQQEQILKSWSSRPVNLVGAGWGGRMADLLMEANSSELLPPTFSLNGSNFFQPGNLSTPIAINSFSGPKLMPFLDETHHNRNINRARTMQRILDFPKNHLMMQFVADVFGSTRDSGRILNSVVQNSPDFGPLDSDNQLDRQLRMTARLISGREQLGMRRQIFFVGLGGWDTHTSQTPQLISLTRKLDDALGNFNQAISTMGIGNDVTVFTASDFGRTLTINGNGSDHGWGGHYLVMGGAVNGGRLYGEWPDYNIGGSSDVGKGRLIPTMSMNQYGAALGSWMGLSNSDLLDVFPDLDRFDPGWQTQFGLFG